MQVDKPLLLILDAYNLAHQVSHTKYGERPNGIAEGFLWRIERLIREFEPDAMLVCWDSGLDPGRVALFPEYKIHRRDKTVETQVRREELDAAVGFLRDRVLTVLGIDQYMGEGPTEADDLIYAAVNDNARSGQFKSVVILSSDRDLDQLLTPPVPDEPWTRPNVYRLSLREKISKEEYANGERLRHRLIDGATLMRKRGYCPAEHLLVAAFAGDKSDGIDGVHGIGPGKMAKLMRKFDGPCGVLSHLNEVTYKAIREMAREKLLRLVQRNLRLMRLRQPAQPPMYLPATASTGLVAIQLLGAAIGELGACAPWGLPEFRDRWLATFKGLMERRSDAGDLC